MELEDFERITDKYKKEEHSIMISLKNGEKIPITKEEINDIDIIDDVCSAGNYHFLISEVSLIMDSTSEINRIVDEMNDLRGMGDTLKDLFKKHE